jgi:hypothetical protein
MTLDIELTTEYEKRDKKHYLYMIRVGSLLSLLALVPSLFTSSKSHMITLVLLYLASLFTSSFPFYCIYDLMTEQRVSGVESVFQALSRLPFLYQSPNFNRIRVPPRHTTSPTLVQFIGQEESF